MGRSWVEGTSPSDFAIFAKRIASFFFGSKKTNKINHQISVNEMEPVDFLLDVPAFLH